MGRNKSSAKYLQQSMFFELCIMSSPSLDSLDSIWYIFCCEHANGSVCYIFQEPNLYSTFSGITFLLLLSPHQLETPSFLLAVECMKAQYFGVVPSSIVFLVYYSEAGGNCKCQCQIYIHKDEKLNTFCAGF